VKVNFKGPGEDKKRACSRRHFDINYWRRFIIL